MENKSRMRRAEVEEEMSGTEVTQYLHQDLRTKKVVRLMVIKAAKANLEGETDGEVYIVVPLGMGSTRH